MSGQAIISGVLLGLASAIAIAISDKFSPTACVPTVEGVLLIVFGLVARKPSARMHAMHGAALVGVIGALLGGGVLVGMISKAVAGTEVAMSKWVSVGGMVLISVVFVILCVNSFIAARKARQAGEVAE